MTETEKEQRRFALAISGGGFMNYFTGVNEMNINIKNCDVNIITETETLEISGKTLAGAGSLGL